MTTARRKAAALRFAPSTLTAPDRQKDAQPATRQANAALLKELNFADREDFEDAQRGLVAGPLAAIIKDGAGKEVWNLKAYEFLKQEDAPATVNPSLWRQAQLNMNAGLFKVVDCVYQVRGLDLSNMTVIEGDTGVILIDPYFSGGRSCRARPLLSVSRPAPGGSGDPYAQPRGPLWRRQGRG